MVARRPRRSRRLLQKQRDRMMVECTGRCAISIRRRNCESGGGAPDESGDSTGDELGSLRGRTGYSSGRGGRSRGDGRCRGRGSGRDAAAAAGAGQDYDGSPAAAQSAPVSEPARPGGGGGSAPAAAQSVSGTEIANRAAARLTNRAIAPETTWELCLAEPAVAAVVAGGAAATAYVLLLPPIPHSPRWWSDRAAARLIGWISTRSSFCWIELWRLVAPERERTTSLHRS